MAEASPADGRRDDSLTGFRAALPLFVAMGDATWAAHCRDRLQELGSVREKWFWLSFWMLLVIFRWVGSGREFGSGFWGEGCGVV